MDPPAIVRFEPDFHPNHIYMNLHAVENSHQFFLRVPRTLVAPKRLTVLNEVRSRIREIAATVKFLELVPKLDWAIEIYRRGEPIPDHSDPNKTAIGLALYDDVIDSDNTRKGKWYFPWSNSFCDVEIVSKILDTYIRDHKIDLRCDGYTGEVNVKVVFQCWSHGLTLFYASDRYYVLDIGDAERHKIFRTNSAEDLRSILEWLSDKTEEVKYDHWFLWGIGNEVWASSSLDRNRRLKEKLARQQWEVIPGR